MRVKFGLVSFFNVLNHERVVFKSLDLLLLSFEVARKLLEFCELDNFAVEKFGLEFGIELAVLYLGNFI
jgi:hypothetical protein